jgi:hypothetical protein
MAVLCAGPDNLQPAEARTVIEIAIDTGHIDAPPERVYEYFTRPEAAGSGRAS